MKRLNVDIEDDVYDELKIKAIRNKKSLSEVIRELIVKYLKSKEGK